MENKELKLYDIDSIELYELRQHTKENQIQ